jgi:hypothetical protein
MQYKLLIRQVKKHLDGMGNIHPQLENFLTAVNYSYQQFDEDYFLLEHTTKSSFERVFIPLERLDERSAYERTGIAWLQHISINPIGRRKQIQRHSA